jgi:hypothetical protein
MEEFIPNWPTAICTIVGTIAFASFFIGKWPTEGIVNLNCQCKHKTNDDYEDEENEE